MVVQQHVVEAGSLAMRDKPVRKAVGGVILNCTLAASNIDPDTNAPRTINTPQGDYGIATAVSLKRKLRDLVLDKLEAFQAVARIFNPDLDLNRFQILEDPNRNRKAIFEMIRDKGVQPFLDMFYDGRLFGNLFLEENVKNGDRILTEQTHMRTGVVSIACGQSIAPVETTTVTCTKKAPIQEGKSRGMAPSALQVVNHGVYFFPFHIEPDRASKTSCTAEDVELFCRLLPFIYDAFRSVTRSQVEVIAVPYVEFGVRSRAYLDILDSFRPVKLADPDKPSMSLSEYTITPIDKNPVVKHYQDLGQITRAVDFAEFVYPME